MVINLQTNLANRDVQLEGAGTSKGSVILRDRTRKNTSTARMARSTMPPTTPPAIAPVLFLEFVLSEGVEVPVTGTVAEVAEVEVLEASVVVAVKFGIAAKVANEGV